VIRSSQRLLTTQLTIIAREETMSSVGLETAIPEIERPQISALDSMAAGFDFISIFIGRKLYFFRFLFSIVKLIACWIRQDNIQYSVRISVVKIL
jgi:hypothetical protein